ncbi:hypothetical protein [Micromonospora purpureochromogenes]|uniref:Uncharacterized protein n=1 Tax=Micromonospora purpureochromogenes TaxID=47872 RepID=A0ABX2RIY7_9ACTN|nr:hypothetical protein [Micromonospora purpureochromogenes]NYF56477.1 hypothetical protein [Micromonospora purpureochromogenes]
MQDLDDESCRDPSVFPPLDPEGEDDPGLGRVIGHVQNPADALQLAERTTGASPRRWVNHGDRRQLADAAGVRSPTPRGMLAARPGRLPAHHHTHERSVFLRRPSGLPALRASRRACCVAGAERSGAAAE